MKTGGEETLKVAISTVLGEDLDLDIDSGPKYFSLHNGNGNWDGCEFVVLVAFEFCI